MIFRSQYAAACAAQCRITSRGGSFQIQPAPGPDDINWQTVLLRKKERNRRSLFVLPLIAIIIFIPMGTLAGVLNTLCANDLTSSSVSEATTLEFMNGIARAKMQNHKNNRGIDFTANLTHFMGDIHHEFWVTLSRPSTNDSRFVIKNGSAIHKCYFL